MATVVDRVDERERAAYRELALVQARILAEARLAATRYRDEDPSNVVTADSTISFAEMFYEFLVHEPDQKSEGHSELAEAFYAGFDVGHEDGADHASQGVERAWAEWRRDRYPDGTVERVRRPVAYTPSARAAEWLREQTQRVVVHPAALAALMEALENDEDLLTPTIRVARDVMVQGLPPFGSGFAHG